MNVDKNIQIVDSEDFFLSRIDRSVADNLNDIRKSFGDDAGIVKDFVVFISKKLKKDLFGYTQFTLNDFCKETGRNRQDLAKKHPYFIDNPKAVIPEYFGHEFVSVFDYTLFTMLQKNIIFSKSYVVNKQNEVIYLKNFPILKDIQLNRNRKSNTIKLYEIRISDEWLEGFISRYYTIETSGYAQIGKGKGGDGRKSLYLILQRTRHQLKNQNEHITRFTVDYLSNLAEIEVQEPRYRKKSLKRILDFLQVNGNMPFTYRFIRADESKLSQKEYWIEFDFSESLQIKRFAETRNEHIFYNLLLRELQASYTFKYKDLIIEGETDPFQRWLNNPNADLSLKIDIVKSCFYKASNIQLTDSEAEMYIKERK